MAKVSVYNIEGKEVDTIEEARENKLESEIKIDIDF